jgi:hypothetical protein
MTSTMVLLAGIVSLPGSPQVKTTRVGGSTAT